MSIVSHDRGDCPSNGPTEPAGSAGGSGANQDLEADGTEIEEHWGHGVVSRAFKITDLQILAIEETLRGYHDSRIAQLLNISRKTLWKWKTFNEDYRRALAEGRAALHGMLVDRLQTTARKAVDTLDDLLDDCDRATRLRAAEVALRAATNLKPETPPHQYHRAGSVHMGIEEPMPEEEMRRALVTIYDPATNRMVTVRPGESSEVRMEEEAEGGMGA